MKNPVLVLAFLFSCIGGIWFSFYFIVPQINNPTTIGQVEYDIDPFFHRFYTSLGGSELLGPAISQIIEFNGAKYQYTENGLFSYDNIRGFYLEPLGIQLGYHKTMYSGGPIEIYSGFYNLYQKLGGELMFGKPLTIPFLNQNMNRLEQHFEHLGIFLSLDEESGAPRLLPYGVYSCDYGCRFKPDDAAIMLKVPEPFRSFVSKYGGEFTGELINDPFLAEDGNTEAIFNNLVLYSIPAQPQGVLVRSIVEILGIEQHQPTKPFIHPDIIFIPTQGELGHNVPKVFDDYLSSHGGLSVAGNPLTELFQIAEGQFRQCFENLCIEYFSRGEDKTPYLTPLGEIYSANLSGP